MGKYGPQSYNLDINQLGVSQFPRFSIIQRAPYKDGLIEDIIMNDDHPQYSSDYGTNIGMAQIRLIPDDRGVPKEQLNWAMPLDSSIREYPLKNEIVMVFYSVGRLFYTKRVNINNKITENSWPGLSKAFSPSMPSSVRSEDIVNAANGGSPFRPWGTPQLISLGDEFAENPAVKMVRPNEGDMIIQGRFGNIIRLGSSVFSNPTASRPEPNLLLTVGQELNKITSTKNPSPYSLVYEDINKDKSCIWMVTDEHIFLEPATIDSPSHLRHTELSDATKYTGAQIFINSDRVILNSKQNEISLFSKKEINLSAVESITIDSAKQVFISAEKDIELSTPQDIVLTARSVVINSPNDIVQGTSENYIISGNKIFIGATPGDTRQPMVLGGELVNWLRDLMTTLSSATIITSTGPALFDPTVIAKFSLLLKDLGVPGVLTAKFNSDSNFTSKTNSN